MKCRACGENDSGVIDSRYNEGGIEANARTPLNFDAPRDLMRRRRRCNHCGSKWTTYELAVDDLNTIAIGGDKAREAMKREMADLLVARLFPEEPR